MSPTFGDGRLPAAFWECVREVDLGLASPCWEWLPGKERNWFAWKGNTPAPARLAMWELVGPFERHFWVRRYCVSSAEVCIRPNHNRVTRPGNPNREAYEAHMKWLREKGAEWGRKGQAMRRGGPELAPEEFLRRLIEIAKAEGKRHDNLERIWNEEVA